MTKPQNKSKIWLRIIIVVFVVLVLGFAITTLSIEVRYKASEKKVQNTESEYIDEYYYYNKLTYKEQLLYKEIKLAAENIKDTTAILPYRYNEDEFKKIALAVRFDCPMLFYMDMNKMELYSDRYKTSVKLYYFESAQEIKSMKMEIEAVSAAAMAFTQNTTTDFEKTVILHDFLTKNCTKSTETDDNESASAHSPYGALVNKEAFCDGYSSALKILLNRCGVECITVEGKIGNQDHVWNIVKIDGSYYHVDSTWNDGDLDFANNVSFHGYFALSDNNISNTHTMSNKFDLPKCDTENTYYSLIDSVVKTTEDFEEIAYNQIKKSIEKDQAYFELFTEHTKDHNDFKQQLLSVIDKINSESDSPILSRSFRAFNATEDGHAKSIQIYYLKK